MRMVTLVFQDVGVMRVAHIMTKSLWMVSRISCGSIPSNLFTIPSGPGDLSLLRVLMHSVKAVLSRILGWSHYAWDVIKYILIVSVTSQWNIYVHNFGWTWK